MDKEEAHHDFANVEKQRDYLTAEEFPEGSYGAARGKSDPVENKSTPWEEGQRYYSAFTYENKSLHENLPRQYDGAHPMHDDPDSEEQPPYTNTDNES
ncbi:cytosolic protein [Peribacillus cavernae]|uniref:Cytosolic protein n=1 Tax=Peribacillus cavernae TaxID=1674310 RepID=A0A433HCF0_9BACI|nr:cytosolic protein [Peribacillus cavernae]MDQ0219661.1 hypothetical protein [Peribacillus cavernae]RUQ25942.1 cytosolic protein [Peribacillus cavernae]